MGDSGLTYLGFVVVGWMRESIAGSGVCMSADRLRRERHVFSSGCATISAKCCLLGATFGVPCWIVSASISPRAGGLEYRQLVLNFGGCCRWAGRRVRVDSNRVMLAGGINQLDDAPYPAIVWADAHLAGRPGQDTACVRCDLVCFSERNKSDGWDKPDVRLAG